MFGEIEPLSSLFFFQSFYDAKYLPLTKKTFFSKEFQLPSTSELLEEEEFAKVFFAWNEEKILLHFEVDEEMKKTVFPNFRSGDSIELFFDTRDLKSRKAVSQFCHHFVFFPEEINGFLGQEITRFRSEGSHELCQPKDLKVEADVQPDHYRMTITIPKYCLHGFEPTSFDRLGFTYRINRSDGLPQHFTVSSDEFAIEHHPDLWSSIKLQREKA